MNHQVALAYGKFSDHCSQKKNIIRLHDCSQLLTVKHHNRQLQSNSNVYQCLFGQSRSKIFRLSLILFTLNNIFTILTYYYSYLHRRVIRIISRKYREITSSNFIPLFLYRIFSYKAFIIIKIQHIDSCIISNVTYRKRGKV